MTARPGLSFSACGRCRFQAGSWLRTSIAAVKPPSPTYRRKCARSAGGRSLGAKSGRAIGSKSNTAPNAAPETRAPPDGRAAAPTGAGFRKSHDTVTLRSRAVRKDRCSGPPLGPAVGSVHEPFPKLAPVRLAGRASLLSHSAARPPPRLDATWRGGAPKHRDRANIPRPARRRSRCRGAKPPRTRKLRARPGPHR